MTEPRCDKCRYWQSQGTQDWSTEGVGFGWCKGVRPRWDIQDEASDGRRHGKEYVEIRKDALKAARAYVQDGSEYHAELITGPDFFCALFKEFPAEMVVAA